MPPTEVMEGSRVNGVGKIVYIDGPSWPGVIGAKHTIVFLTEANARPGWPLYMTGGRRLTLISYD